jgi:hypothetical protein
MLPKWNPDELIELLREEAREELAYVFPDASDVKDMPAWEAADMIEAFYEALKKIAEGAADPIKIANVVIDPQQWTLVKHGSLNAMVNPSRSRKALKP